MSQATLFPEPDRLLLAPEDRGDIEEFQVLVRELASRRDLTSDQARWVGRFATHIERLPLAPPIAEVTLRISDSSESVGAVRTISLSRDSLVLSSEIGRPSSGSSSFRERHTTLVASMAGRVCDSRAELADWLGVLRTLIRGDPWVPTIVRQSPAQSLV